MIKVIIFSDIRIYCEGLSQILSTLDELHVVGSESHFEDAVDKIGESSADVVLLDMTMQGSCHSAKKILQHFPALPIVALAAPEDKKNVINCAEVGIAGYVAREASLDVLIETVKSAKRGEVSYPPKIATFIFNRFRQISSSIESSRAAEPVAKSRPTSALLTERERQIARLLAEGLSNKEISRSLSIEVSTVKNHVHSVLVKLDVKNRVQVVSLLQGMTLQGSGSMDLDREASLTI